jgi:hypothetical protein
VGLRFGVVAKAQRSRASSDGVRGAPAWVSTVIFLNQSIVDIQLLQLCVQGRHSRKAAAQLCASADAKKAPTQLDNETLKRKRWKHAR